MSTARINRLFLAGARQAAGVEIVAVGSRDSARGDEFAREHGIERTHHGYAALIADPDVDAVYIPLPNSMHAEWTVRALEAGKHVLCEKPLSRRTAEVERAFDVAERQGRVLMEGFMYRHNPQTRRLAKLVAGGAVGRLRLIRAQFSFLAEVPDIRLSRELGGGALMELMLRTSSLGRSEAATTTSAWSRHAGHATAPTTPADSTCCRTSNLDGGHSLRTPSARRPDRSAATDQRRCCATLRAHD